MSNSAPAAIFQHGAPAPFDRGLRAPDQPHLLAAEVAEWRLKAERYNAHASAGTAPTGGWPPAAAWSNQPPLHPRAAAPAPVDNYYGGAHDGFGFTELFKPLHSIALLSIREVGSLSSDTVEEYVALVRMRATLDKPTVGEKLTLGGREEPDTGPCPGKTRASASCDPGMWAESLLGLSSFTLLIAFVELFASLGAMVLRLLF
jgi:hypothetical protein